MRMPAGIQVLDAPHILRPAYGFGILRASENEAPARFLFRYLHEQFVDLWLTIGSIRPHVTEVATVAFSNLAPAIEPLVKAAIQRQGPFRIEDSFEFGQKGSTGEAEVEVNSGNLVAAQVWRAAFGAKLGHSDRSVDIVKGGDRNPRLEHEVNGGNAVGKIGADHRDVGVSELTLDLRNSLLPIAEDTNIAEFRMWQGAGISVPIEGLLEEDDLVPALVQSLGQRTKCGGVTISPRRSYGQAADDDFHRVIRPLALTTAPLPTGLFEPASHAARKCGRATPACAWLRRSAWRDVRLSRSGGR